MAWYPGATKMELQPESDNQPAIRPTQFIVHSIAGPWTAKRTYEYWRDSTNLESHFALGYEGDLAQFIGTQTRADSNAAANRRADGTGAVSIETASNTAASDPWTAAQVEQLIKLGVWMHTTHGVPLRLCRTADDPGFGYHRLFDAWNPNGHSCPGPARIAQFKTVVLPGIIARAAGTEEDDVALTTDDINKIAAATAAKLAAGGGVLEGGDLTRVWNTEVVPAARPPYANSDYATNKTWTPGYALGTAVEAARKAASQSDVIAAQAKANGEALSKVLALLNDPASDFATKLTAALEGLDFQVVRRTS